MLITRILAAMVFTPVLFCAVVMGGAVLKLCCATLSILMLWEALRLLMPQEAHRQIIWTAWATGLVVLSHQLAIVVVPPSLFAAVLCLPMLVAALFAPGAMATQISAAAQGQLAVVYAMGLMPLLWRLRERADVGLGLSLLALFCCFASDTGAYFCGRLLGRRKLYPRVSPGKTLEGAIGGLVFALVMAWAIFCVLLYTLPLGQVLTLGLVAAIFGILGDLCESVIKRQAGVKDSSHIIPGHGGLLDRFDGVLFALCGTEAYTTWVLRL